MINLDIYDPLFDPVKAFNKFHKIANLKSYEFTIMSVAINLIVDARLDHKFDNDVYDIALKVINCWLFCNIIEYTRTVHNIKYYKKCGAVLIY